MLTCKVGENIINCFDVTYDKHQLKEWSDKNILICPDCLKPYEYCHGRIIPPYFRHKDKNKDCVDIYSESETKEHMEGKTALYHWLLNIQDKGTIHNLKLESYIPETKQRPDIYFECDNLKYVIEFQCSPIASEYLERHELYQLANINDIWILGLSKYNISGSGNHIVHSPHYKAIEQYSDFYLNAESKYLYVKSDLVKQFLPFNKIRLNDYYMFNLEELYFDVVQKRVLVSDSALDSLVDEDAKENARLLALEEIENKLQNDIRKITDVLNDKYKAIKGSYNFSCVQSSSLYYLYSIDFDDKYDQYRFFIKSNKVDYCKEYESSTPFRGKHGGTGWRMGTHYSNIDSITYDSFNVEDVLSFIVRQIDNSLEGYRVQMKRKEIETQKCKDKYREYFGDFLDKEIFLVSGGDKDIPKSIRFKFLKGFSTSDNYMINTFSKELGFLKSINANKYVFMIPKYNSYHNCLGFSGYVRVGDLERNILEHFESYGFTNVNYLEY